MRQMLNENTRQWAQVNQEDLSRFMLANCQQKRKYKRHEEIKVNAPYSVILYVAAGQIKAYVYNEQGSEKLLYYADQDNVVLGNYCLETNICLRIVAASDCEVYFLETKTAIAALLKREGGLDRLIDGIDSRISAFVYNLLESAGNKQKGQICQLIYSLAMRSNRQIDGKIFLKQFPTRTDIALFIGTHKSNVIKYLKELEQAGVIEKHEKGYLINDMQKLERLIMDEYKTLPS